MCECVSGVCVCVCVCVCVFVSITRRLYERARYDSLKSQQTNMENTLIIIRNREVL